MRNTGRQRQGIAILLFFLSLAAAPVQAGQVVDLVRSRGELRCGVSEGTPGFSAQDAAGHWHGLDVDFCRGLAAAILGDPGKVRFFPLRASARFPSLLSGQVDLLARNTTWTLTREALLKVRFPATLYYDSQGFLVRRDAQVRSMADLRGEVICVEKGTTHALRLGTVFAARGLTVTPLVTETAADSRAALFAGRCKAYSADASHLAGIRLEAETADDYLLLPERLSKEPLGPVVRQEDPEWETLVRWVVFLLFAAEEFGVTSANIDAASTGAIGSDWRVAGLQDDAVPRSLGLRPGWARQIIRSVGNYAEMFDRNLGADSPLQLDRGLNRLWNAGGLMYAPPLE